MNLPRLTLLLGVLVGGCRTYTVTYTDDGGPCSTPRTICNGQCVDITTDRGNCGQCGHACGMNELCLAGGDGGSTCQPCPNATNTVCGTGGGSFCADTTSDDNNCGGCGNACGHGSHCLASSCVCSLTTCGTDCVDLQTDVSHCGSCANACGMPAANEIELCTSGHCAQQCVSPFADCDGLASNGCETDLLTDPSNCGLCGRSCGSGATCSQGICPIVTYSSSNFLHGLAVDSSYVYWASAAPTTGGIYEAPKAGVMDGGTPQLLVNTMSAVFVGVDASYLTWIQNVQTASVDSRLLSGGSLNTLAALSGLNGEAMALAGGYVYYATSDAKLSRVPEDGSGAPTVLASSALARSIAVDGSNVYVVSGGDIATVPITATNAALTSFALMQQANALTIDASNVYWTTMAGTVVFAPKGSPGSTVLVAGQTNPSVIASDGTNIYWASFDGAIHRASVTGLQLITLAMGQGTVGAIAVDSTRVYWTGSNGAAATVK